MATLCARRRMAPRTPQGSRCRELPGVRYRPERGAARCPSRQGRQGSPTAVWRGRRRRGKGARKNGERDAAREFLEKLPESLRAFANNAPAAELLQIYRKAFVDELLAERNFGGVLQPKKQMRPQCRSLRSKNIRYPLRLNLNIQRGRKSSRSGRWQNGSRISDG